MPGAGTTPQFRWPVVIGSSSKTLRYTDGSGTADQDMAEGTFWWRGDGSADDLTTRLDTLLTAAAVATGSGQTYTVALGDDGLLTITEGGAASFTLEWAHANTTLNPATFGFDAANQTSVAGVMVSDFQVGSAWFPEQVYVDETEDFPAYRANITGLMNGRVRTQLWGSLTKRSILLDVLPPEKIFTAEETVGQEAFQRWYAQIAQGTRFEFCPDFPNTRGTYSTYVPDPGVPDQIQQWPATIPHGTIRRYDIRLFMQSYVA